jgi:hypothetical protein
VSGPPRLFEDVSKRSFLITKTQYLGARWFWGSSGSCFTIYQISSTNSTLQATNAYSIQKDARELAIALPKEAAFYDYVIRFDPNKTYSPELIADANRAIGRLINFYLSVFRQFQAGGISRNFAASFGRDFCDAVKSSRPVERYLTALISAKGSDLKDMKDAWCP